VRPPVVITREFDQEWVLSSGPRIKALLPKEFHDAALCPGRGGVTRHGVAGPDYTVLVPANLRRDTADLQRRIGRLTWYLICTRPRVRAIPAECYIANSHLHMGFVVSLDGGREEVLTTVAPEPTNADTVTVEPGGVDLVLRTSDGQQRLANASVVAQVVMTPDPYEPCPLDLEVRYIGRARGDLATKCALDRLDEHKPYQTILEEVQSHPYENREIVLLLCSGTTLHISCASDHPPSDAETKAEYAAVERARELLTEQVRVDAVETLLINLFKPPHNTHYVGELDPRWHSFDACRQAGLTGLTLLISTESVHCGLYTATRQTSQNFHHTVCL
jgi:hypothetical protein